MGVGNGEWGIEEKSTLTVLESRFRRTPDSRLPTPQLHKKYAIFYAQQLNNLQPLIAPAVSPCTIRRWKNSTSNTKGKVPKTVAAAIAP